MSLNDEISVSLNEETSKKDEKPVKQKKKITKKKLFSIIFGICLSIVVAVAAAVTYSALTYVVGCFYDYSMAPTINKVIKNEEGKEYSYDNFKNRNGNIVEYGLIEPIKTKPTFKRFEVVATRQDENDYIFDAFRVVGFPGETVKLDYDGNLYINGTLTEQPIAKEYLKLDWSDYDEKNKDKLCYELTLKENEYYLLKDNRYYYENDSRRYGAYEYEEIYGTVIAIQGTCTIDNDKFYNCSFPFPRFI